MTREHGKTLVESRGDVKRGIEMVEFACGVPSLLMCTRLLAYAHAVRLLSTRSKRRRGDTP